MDLGRIDLSRVYLDPCEEAKEASFQRYRIQYRADPGTPPRNLPSLKLWDPEAGAEALPSVIQPLEVCRYGRVNCRLLLRDPGVIQRLRGLEERLLSELTAAIDGFTEEELHRTYYGKAQSQPLLRTQMIRGRQEAVLEVAMERLEPKVRRMVSRPGGFGPGEKGDGLGLADIGVGSRLFPVVHITAVHCYAQKIQVEAVAAKAALLCDA